MSNNPAVENGAPAPRLTRMEFVYQLEGEDEQTVVVHNRSLIAWDETRVKRRWPVATDAPSLWQTFILFHHLSRTGAYAGDFDTFRERCIGLELVDEKVPVDPTQLAATPDSFSPLD